jgi:hypothetical protein
MEFGLPWLSNTVDGMLGLIEQAETKQQLITENNERIEEMK